MSSPPPKRTIANVDAITIATWVLAIITFLLVIVTFWMARRLSEDSRVDLKVRNHMMMEEKFDSPIMVACRKKLALALLAGAPHDEIQDDVMNFFETVGLLYKRDLIERELAYNTFSYYAPSWWYAVEAYVRDERSANPSTEDHDPTIFEEFEYLTAELNKVVANRRRLKPSDIEAEIAAYRDTFLKEESELDMGGSAAR